MVRKFALTRKWKRALSVLIGIVVAFGIVLAIVVIITGRADSKNLQQAKSTGEQYAKRQCNAEGLAGQICSSIKASATFSQCGEYTCWVVIANASDRRQFGADMFVILENGQFVVSNYGRLHSTEK